MAYDQLINKYSSYDIYDVFILYDLLLDRFCGCILSISDLSKEDILDKYFLISSNLLSIIMSKEHNEKFPELNEKMKNLYEDISNRFLDYFSDDGVTFDEIKMMSLKSKIDVTQFLKEKNDLYE